MIKSNISESGRERTITWAIRFIKFNLIGIFVFSIGTAIFASVFPYFGSWAWLIANGAGSLIQFSLISYFNKKKRGLIFEQCPIVKE